MTVEIFQQCFRGTQRHFFSKIAQMHRNHQVIILFQILNIKKQTFKIEKPVLICQPAHFAKAGSQPILQEFLL